MVKKEMEDRRKERLAYVGISLNNVLPAKEKKEKKSQESSDSEETSRENTPSGSDSNASDSDEPIYQLRQRRQAHSYKFQDYDDLINSALDVRDYLQFFHPHFKSSIYFLGGSPATGGENTYIKSRQRYCYHC